MKRIKLIYIHPSQLSERWLRYYYLDELSKEFDVEYWDCSAIASPSFMASPIVNRSYVVEIKSLEALQENLLRVDKNSLIINDLHLNAGNFRIYCVIAKYFKNRIYINFFSNTKGAYKSKLFSKFANSKLKDIVAWIILRMKFKFYVFSSIQGSRYRINHPDYDLFLSLQNNVSKENEQYGVYIDNFFPFHPEIRKREPYVAPKKIAPFFYDSMNNFFSQLEQKYHCKIKILAHPSSMYSENPFDGREIIKGCTGIYVKNARFVCMHTSNSISFVILYSKPVVLLSNKAYKEAKLEEKKLEVLAEEMCLPVVDSDMPIESAPFRQIKDNIREKYIGTYLMCSEKESNLDLFKRYFKKIYKEIEIVSKESKSL